MLCFFCVLQIFLCRVLSLPLTLKISQTCSLSIVYTVNIRKITNHTAVATNTCQSTKRDKTEPPAPETTQKHKAESISKDGLPQEKKTGNMYSSTDTQREPTHGSPARALVNRCDKLRLELAHWFTTWFQAGGRRTASRREDSLHTRTQ